MKSYHDNVNVRRNVATNEHDRNGVHTVIFLEELGIKKKRKQLKRRLRKNLVYQR